MAVKMKAKRFLDTYLILFQSTWPSISDNLKNLLNAAAKTSNFGASFLQTSFPFRLCDGDIVCLLRSDG